MKTLLSILFSILLAACVTQKSALKETIKDTETVQNDIAKTTDTHIESASAITVCDLSIVNDTTVTNSITTRFSAPDSNGKQYPTELTKSTTKSWSKKANNVNTQAKKTIDNKEQTRLSDKSNFQFDSQQAIEKKTTVKTTTPAWVKLAVVVFTLVLLTASYFFLRRFGVITWVIGVFVRLFRSKSI
jgi:hypothetical protein